MSLVYGKCKRLKDSLEKHGLKTDNVDYYKNGEPLDEPLKESDLEKITWCRIYANDTELEAELEKAGKMGGVWTTVSEVEIHKQGIPNTDIAVNLASCRISTTKSRSMSRMQNSIIDALNSLGKLPKKCKVESIHTHNSEDANAAVHLHISCEDSSIESVDAIKEVIEDANRVGWRMCGKLPTRRLRVNY